MTASNVVPLGSWERLKASRAYKVAESNAAFAALCVVGTHDRQRRTWSDNEGGYPVRLVVTTDPKTAPNVYNRGVHSREALYHTLTYVWFASRTHAENAKTWIEDQMKAEPMLSGWWDREAWQVQLLLGAAVEVLGFEAFDEVERLARIRRMMLRG